MEISFSTQQDVQIVQIKGRLGQTEAGAVRFKLEQKISLGRMKVLFDLADYDLRDNTARDYLMTIIAFCMNRGVTAACCGISSPDWPLIAVPGPVQPRIFLSLPEGLSFLATLPKKQEAPKPSENESKGDEEKRIKSKALEELLAKYAVFQQSDDGDPFRLDFHLAQYKTQPFAEALNVERKAVQQFEKTKSEVELLESRCEQLAFEVKQATLNRKTPFTESELNIKEAALKKSLDETKTVTAGMKSKIADLRAKIEASKKELADTKTQYEQEFQEIQDRAKKMTTDTETMIQNLNSQNAKEEKEFAEKVAALNKPTS